MAKKAASKTVVAKRVAKSQPISPEQVRAWWSFRQGLDQVRSELTAEQILERYGWARSVAGAGHRIISISWP